MVTRCSRVDFTKKAKPLLGEQYCSVCRYCNNRANLESKIVGNALCAKGEVWVSVECCTALSMPRAFRPNRVARTNNLPCVQAVSADDQFSRRSIKTMASRRR